MFRFYHDLFHYKHFNPNDTDIVNINADLSRFLLSCNLGRDIFNEIYTVIIGKSKNTINLYQLISFMNLVYIVQNDNDKQLPDNYSLILNDMSLDTYYYGDENNNNNDEHINIPIMNYPSDFNHPFITSINIPQQHSNDNYPPSHADSERLFSNDEEYDSGYPDTGNTTKGHPDDYHIPLRQSTSPLTPSPPPILHSPSKDMDEGKADQLSDDDVPNGNKYNTPFKPKPAPISIDNEAKDSLDIRAYEFKRFFDTNMNCPRKEEYYQCFIEKGYADIGLLLHLDLDILVNDCGIDKVYARYFMKKIEEFNESHERFKKFICDELDMMEYWDNFCNKGIKTFGILYERISGYIDIANIINGDEHAAKIIYYNLPKIKRQQSENSPSNDRKLSDHPTTPFL